MSITFTRDAVPYLWLLVALWLVGTCAIVGLAAYGGYWRGFAAGWRECFDVPDEDDDESKE